MSKNTRRNVTLGYTKAPFTYAKDFLQELYFMPHSYLFVFSFLYNIININDFS